MQLKTYLIKTFSLCSFILIVQTCCAQTEKEQAVAKAKEAIRLEDEEGKYDDAILLFQDAEKLDPDNIVYPYEVAYAYQGKKEYKKASDILEKLLQHKDVYSRVYQALGNCYDFQGNPKKAIETYEAGLKKFPNAGELYLELGNMHIVNKEYSKALTYYELGIVAAPSFPSNYYWASRIFCGSEESVWGLLYGEIFMNLERNSKRTVEISKLLFDTYKNGIRFTSDTSYTISFCKNAVLSLSDLKDPLNFKMPFGMGCYEMIMTVSVLDEKTVDLNSLDRIRNRFIEKYSQGESALKYPNVLFDYQEEISKAGHLEAYNHWLLMKGDEENFKKWQMENKSKWDEFVKWYSQHPLQLDTAHKFYRAQYQ